MAPSSIQVSSESKSMWDSYKNHPSESYESMINRILKSHLEDDSELITAEDIVEIKASIAEIEQGHFKTQAQMKAKYGL